MWSIGLESSPLHLPILLAKSVIVKYCQKKMEGDNKMIIIII